MTVQLVVTLQYIIQDLFIISIHKNILAKLKAKNIKIFSFTNQPGIADGIATVADFVQELEGFGFDDIYVCPHKHGDGCECRKPSTGMPLKRQKHGLNLTQCAVVGDRWTDIVAGAKVNATTILVRTGAGYDALHTYRDKWAHIEPNYIADNFEDATNWVLNQL